MNVIVETGIKVLRLGSNQPMDCEIFLTEYAERKIIPKKTAIAASAEGGSSPPMIIKREDLPEPDGPTKPILSP